MNGLEGVLALVSAKPEQVKGFAREPARLKHPLHAIERTSEVIHARYLERFYRAGARFLTRAIWRPQYDGFEKIPSQGPVLIIANHVSYLDGLIITAGLDRPVRYVIDRYIYEMPVVHYFMSLARAIPVEAKRDSVAAMLEAVKEALEAGEVVCIFPEGQLTYTGNLGRFRPGIEWIVKQCPAPVYPIVLTGLWGSVFSRKYMNAPWPFLPRQWGKKIVARCGEPVPPAEIKVNHLQRVLLALLTR